MNSLNSDSESETDVLAAHEAMEKKKSRRLAKIESVIEEKVLKDNSPEAKLGRRNMWIRAVYGEFMCTLIFLTPIFGSIMNGTLNGYSPELISLIAAFVSGFQAVAVSFAFSSISGAHFNSNISFALWLTGKLSNRRFVVFVIAQLLASVIGIGIAGSMFYGNMDAAYDACSITPKDSDRLGKVFATEFFLTFILTYVAFTVAFEEAESEKKNNLNFKGISDSKGLTVYASNPQSKTGFAPLAIGLTIFSLNLIGGSSGGAFNEGRMFGPAIASGNWDYFYIYWIAQLCGAAAAALLVTNLHKFGLGSPGLTQPITTRLSMDVGYMKDIDHMNASGKNPMNDGL